MEKFLEEPQTTNQQRLEIVKLQDFLAIIQTEWKKDIGRICRKTNKFKQADRNSLMALQKDIVTLAAYIQGQYRTMLRQLNTRQVKHSIYDNLMHSLVSYVTLLGRRRPVDFKSATLNNYLNLYRDDKLIEMAAGK